MPAKPTVAEAKRNFAAAMDKLSVADAVREHPVEIVGAAVAAGAAKAGGARPDVVVDRREAIHRGILEAAPADIVLVAGKGHETEQITKTGTHHFSDAEVIREAFNERRMRALSA